MKKLNSEINYRNATFKSKENFPEQNARKISKTAQLEHRKYRYLKFP